jgi:hypothetical protein
MITRKLIPFSLVVALVLFAGITQNVGSSRAQGSPVFPNTPLGVNVPPGTSFTYQGMLTNASDTPINESCDFTFRLYDALSGGNQVGTDQVKTSVSVSKGQFTVTLDFGSAAFTGEARWLDVAVRCPAGSGTYSSLTPRQELTPAPYASYAQTVGAHSHWGDSWGGIGVGLVISSTNDLGLDVGGYNTGVYAHSDTGSASVGWVSATSGQTVGVYGQSDSPDGVGVRGQASIVGVYGFAHSTSESSSGVKGEASSTAGAGVTGIASATEGFNYGVLGISNSTGGLGVSGYNPALSGTTYGVFGRVDSPDGIGVNGWASATSGSAVGVNGQSDSPTGRGVVGFASASNGISYGVWGTSLSTDGFGTFGQGFVTGVFGIATNLSGYTYGVRGQTPSTDGYGVYGWATATSGAATGAFGQSDSTAGIGVRGEATATSGNAYGVLGISQSDSGRGVVGVVPRGNGFGVLGSYYGITGAGVEGQASSSTSNYGVYSYGNFGATGTKAAVVNTQSYGWLHLYSMESPEVLFEDVGTAQLVDGLSVVTLDPKYAETVNLNAPYQVFVTPLGDCALYVTEKTTTSFTVRALGGAKCSLAFDYRIIAKRLGYEDTRMAPAEDPNLALQNNQSPVEPQP